MKFLIVGLPRSRTAWFSCYFSGCGHPTIHEGMKYGNSWDDYYNLMENYEGDSNPGGMLIETPPEKVVIIERNPEEVISSLVKIYGIDAEDFIAKLIYKIKDKLDKMKGLRVQFNEINDKLQGIHEYCVETPYNQLYGDMMKDMNIQVTEYFYQPNKILEDSLCQRG